MKNRVLMLLTAAVLCGCGSNSRWQHQTFAFSLPADPRPAAASTNVVALKRVSVAPLFQSRAFTYRTGEDTYEQDPYAGFALSPEGAMAEPVRAWMRESGMFGRLMEPGSELAPTLSAEVSVDELCGDFRNTGQPVGSMKVHFVVYEMNDGAPGRIMLDKVCARETPLARRNPAALMAAWDADLREIMQEIDSDYAKAHSNDSGR